MRTTMMNALLCTLLAILSNSVLVGAGDNSSVSVLQNPVLSLQLNSYAEMARTVSAAIHLQEHDRRLQSIDFQAVCDTVEASLPFSCDCDDVSRTASCVSDELCNPDRDTCATFEIVNKFATNFALLSVQTCGAYTKQVATDYKDGCAIVNLKDNGQVFDTCEISFVDDNGDLTICNECSVCDGRFDAPTFDIDCSNVEVEASTSGCMVIEDDTGFFPGLLGVTSASDGPPVGLMRAAAIATLLVGLLSF
jgi:hypothetical protein